MVSIILIYNDIIDKILKHTIVQKRIEYFKAFANEDLTEDQALLQTIRIPKNLLFLSDKLPLPNYDKISKKNYNSFSHQKESLSNYPKTQQSNPLRLPDIKKPLKEPNTIQIVRVNNNDNLNTESESQTKTNILQEKKKEGMESQYNDNDNEEKSSKEKTDNVEPVMLKRSVLNSGKKIAQLPGINAKEPSINHININIKKSAK